MFFRSVYQLLAYYLTLILFGVCGLYLSLFALIAGIRPSTRQSERFFQRTIHWHFALFHRWCEWLRLVRVRYRGFENLPPGVVLVANHLSLIDITCLLAGIPEAVCIFKPGIRRNPVLGVAARRAGYLASDGGHEVLRDAADKVVAGQTLIIFPEGTRTPPGVSLQPFKPGFVLIARRAAASVQLVKISSDSDVLSKGLAWWKLPKFPATVQLTAGPLIPIDPTSDALAVSAEIEAWFRQPSAPPEFNQHRADARGATRSQLTTGVS